MAFTQVEKQRSSTLSQANRIPNDFHTYIPMNLYIIANIDSVLTTNNFRTLMGINFELNRWMLWFKL